MHGGISVLGVTTDLLQRAHADSFVGRKALILHNEYFRKTFSNLFDRYVPATMLFLQKECKTFISSNEFKMVQTLLCIFEATVNNLWDASSKKALSEDHVKDYAFEACFVFSCVWAFGSVLGCVNGVDYKRSFSTWWKSKWTTVKFPIKGTVFDYKVDLKHAAVSIVPWCSPTHKAEDIVVKGYASYGIRLCLITPEIAALSTVLNMLLKKQSACLLLGFAGCGKSSALSIVLKQTSPEVQVLPLVFNYLTDSALLQKKIENNLEKKVA